MPWMSAEPTHQPVLLEASLGLLDLRPGGVYVDATAGLGGHAVQAAARVAPGGVVVLNDVDASMLERAHRRVSQAVPSVRVEAIHGSFAGLGRALAERGLMADALLADLGFSSAQVDDASRGFSFRQDGPLDMRLNPSQGTSAAELLARVGEGELAEILWRYGQERASRRIARKVVEARARQPITTTRELAELVRSCTSGGGIDPATRTFQALRIAVNDELGALSSLLEAISAQAGSMVGGSSGAPASVGLGTAGGTQAGRQWLAKGARVAIIAFHSLEDRLVKRAFADLAERGLARRLTRKPVVPSDAEVAANRRARSAKLRAVELVGSCEGGSGR
ncbi:MAG: ribosomal RNA small subunit methyltransferase H [Phycisphaerales bacterium]|nr:MAG: ribosomal RNA small subunit methyltransferase H [Phycisphaerales bacterium]